MRIKIAFVLLTIILVACTPVQTYTPDVQKIAGIIVQTGAALTQTALPTSTPAPIPTSTPALFFTGTPYTSTRPTVISTYEADHEAIRKVIAAYFDKIYAMHNSFQVDGFGDTVSTGDEAAGFRKTELRKQAVDIVWARLNFLRYASYSYTLNYSEIVVYDSGQRARANFTEGNSIVFELSIPYGIDSQTGGIHHIMTLDKEPNGWKIIYDVHDDEFHRSLYAPTPFPADVLSGLDKTLISLSQAQGGPALPKPGKAFIQSNPAQLAHWKEYESALAEKLLPQYPRDAVSCEWELTARFEQKINVWAVCMTSITSADVGNYYFPAASVPAVINLDSNGAVLSVDIPGYGDQYLADFWRLFPNGAWKDLPDVSAMEEHLNWRRTHPSEPPLVVLNATAILTATPAASPTP